jgi:glucose/arabinose dehydrogenase
MTRVIAPLLVIACAASVIAAALAGVPTKPNSTEQRVSPAIPERLPDLDQETPSLLQVTASGTSGQPTYRLGFRSAVRNIGDGPLEVVGTRSDRETPFMSVAQRIQRVGAPPKVVPAVGRMRYTVSPDHRHWHYLDFERYELQRYELRPAGSTEPLFTDRKTGFCLGDRYRVSTRPLAAAPPEPVYTGSCGLDQPDRLRLREGISVGYGDDYSAFLEGQDLPLNGLPDGRYVLVHRVNVDHGLRELSYANNASSVLLDLHWRGGKPYLRVLAECPDTDLCDRHVEVRTVATGLEIPWDIAFLPDGRALVTERRGRVRLLEADGALRDAPVASVPVSARGEGGLLGLALDPEFSANQFVYLYFTTGSGMKLERWRWTGSSLVRETTLVDAIAAGEIHDSGRIDFGPGGRLYVATGDAGQPELAQDPGSLNGKILALTSEQYRGPGTVRPDIVASGLRNPQGFDWQPGTGVLIANDHGPSGFDGPEGYDEVNRIVQGGNYAWPEAIAYDTDGGRFSAPLRVYRDPIAPSGGSFVARAGSVWTGSYVLAALRGEALHRLELSGGRVVVDEVLLRGRFGRLRTVREGPNGCLYVLTSNRDGRGTPRPGDDRVLCVLLPGS